MSKAATTDQSSLVLPWKLRVLITLSDYVTDFSRTSSGQINRRFMNLLNPTSKVPPKPLPDLTITDVTVDPIRNLWFRLFVPTTGTASLPVFVFFHGGGFAFLSADSLIYDKVCRRFARKLQAIVVSVNYRLTPEHRYPAQYEDGFDTLKFLDERSFDGFPENADLSRCFLVGDSAGGNLAHNMARRVAETEGQFSELKVIGLIAIQPFFGGEERTDAEIQLPNGPIVNLERTDWMWKVFLPEGCDRDHEAANVFGPNSSDISGLTKFPATMVVVGGFDPLQDWQRRYYKGLERAGKDVYLVEYPSAIHAFYVFPELPDSSCLFDEVKGFVQKQTNKKDAM